MAKSPPTHCARKTRVPVWPCASIRGRGAKAIFNEMLPPVGLTGYVSFWKEHQIRSEKANPLSN